MFIIPYESSSGLDINASLWSRDTILNFSILVWFILHQKKNSDTVSQNR